MSTKTILPAIVRLTMTSRSSCEWTMERIADAQWIPTLGVLVSEVEQLDSHSDEHRIWISGAPALEGLVIRGTCPSHASRSAYVVLWPQPVTVESVQPTETPGIADYDAIGRLLLLLMAGSRSGVSAAQSLVETTAARKAAAALSGQINGELRIAAREYAAQVSNRFDALLVRECVRSGSE